MSREIPTRLPTCNQAYGTIVAVTNGAPLEVQAQASLYPLLAHQRVQSESGDQSAYFACHHDYNDFDSLDIHHLPQGLVSLREAINFPEGPLYWDAPRPDSTNNAFCLSCHTQEGFKGLSIQALAEISGLNAIDDPRRQPRQPLPFVYGFIPADWLGEGLPVQAIETNDDGVKIDQYLLQSVSSP